MPHQNKASSVIAEPLEFAKEGRHLAGEVEVAVFDRLADLLADKDGRIAWEVTGSVESDAGGSRKFLLLEARGELRLVCQRCLGSLVFPLRLSSRLELMPPGTEWPDEELEDDSFDAIEATKDMVMVDLLEDEILLALPAVPRHEQCAGPADAAEKQDQAVEKVSPFAILAGLKKDKH